MQNKQHTTHSRIHTLQTHPPRAAAHPLQPPPALSPFPAAGSKSQLGGRDGGSCCLSTKPKRSYITYELPLPVRVLSGGLVPGCSRLGADRMHQLICTNGPRKARSALQRRMHLSNNLNRHAFPSKKSLRREREALQLSFSPHLQRNLAGDVGKELPGQGKASDLQSGEQLLEKAGSRLDVQPRFRSPLGQTDGSPERAWLHHQPKAKMRKVIPSVPRQVDIEGKMPK